MSPHSSKPSGPASREELEYYQVPLHLRDNCSAILIPLNICRRENYFLPWYCEHERHAYEVCMYKEYEKRRAIKNAQKAKAAATAGSK